MNLSINKLSAAIATLLTLTFATASQAQSISQALRGNSQNTTENYFEIGLGYTNHEGPSTNPRKLDWTGSYSIFNWSYNYKGFFLERFADKFTESTDPFVIGYNAYTNDNWSFDIIGSSKNPGLKLIGVAMGGENNGQEIDFVTRDSDFMIGGRLSGYFGNNILQFSVSQDIRRHHGRMASALVGRNWQLRNWNFHGLLGVQYSDSTTNDYYKGVRQEEADRSSFTAYQAGGGFNYNAEVGVTYPINEDWVYRATATVVSYSDEQLNSPMYHSTSGSTSTTFSTSISYVF